MNGRKASGFRTASRVIGYGGVIACIIAAVVWYIIHVMVKEETVEYLQINGKDVFPKGLTVVAIAAVAVIVVAIILRIVAARSARRFAEDVAFLNAQEESDEDEDSAYDEEPLAPIGAPSDEEPKEEPAPAPEVIAAPAEEAATVSEKVVGIGVGKASVEIRVPTNPAKKAKRVEKKAKRDQKTAKIKASLGKKVNKVLPPEKRDELKKKIESVKKAAKVIVPVAVACVVVAKVAKKRRQKKLEKEKARNRRQFYQWLG